MTLPQFHNQKVGVVDTLSGEFLLYNWCEDAFIISNLKSWLSEQLHIKLQKACISKSFISLARMLCSSPKQFEFTSHAVNTF